MGAIHLQILKQTSSVRDPYELAHTRLHDLAYLFQLHNVVAFFRDVLTYENPVLSVWCYAFYCWLCIYFPGDYVRTYACGRTQRLFVLFFSFLRIRFEMFDPVVVSVGASVCIVCASFALGLFDLTC